MKLHRGASLVELMVLMSACSVILTMSAGLIHRAMRSHSQTRAYFDVERTALRLSGQFRGDVHQAAAATTESGSLGEGGFLGLQLAGGNRVEYRRLNESVVRLLFDDGRIVSQETFPFSPTMEVVLEDEESPRRFVLSITREPGAMDAGSGAQPVSQIGIPVSVQVEAVLSRDWRFAPTAAAGDTR